MDRSPNSSSSPISIFDESFSSMDSDSSPELSVNHPLAIIRRPIIVPVTPVGSSQGLNHSPYPRDPIVSPFEVATPVIITPVDARSTRDIVRVNRIRRVRRRQESRIVLNSIRRRLSMITTGENRTEIQLTTPRTLPRSKIIDKTSTAIELETSDVFQIIFSEALKEKNNVNTNSEAQDVPSTSYNCAKMREINRLEALDLGFRTMKSSCEEEILEAIGLLEWKISQMASEAEDIERILSGFRDEKQRKLRKWEIIELILRQIRAEEQ